MRFLLPLLAITLAAPARAGYEIPCFIDPAQSADGRYAVSAEPVGRPSNHGPNRWRFTFRDTLANTSVSYDARGVQGGQVHAHLFVPPGGKAFALFNHVTLWTEGKSNMHASGKLRPESGGQPDRALPEFTRRLIVYSAADGSIVGELGVADVLTPDEWAASGAVFNRVHWVKEYPGLNFKKTPRPGYAFYRVSPDYSTIEFRVTPPRASKDQAGRLVHVSLGDGRVLDAAASAALRADPARAPARPYVGPDVLSATDDTARERYVPSPDPVRAPGQLREPPPAEPAKPKKDRDAAAPAEPGLELVRDGFTKLDTPAWLAAEKALIFTDLDAAKTYRLDPPDKITEVRPEAARLRAGPDGRLYGVLDGKLSSWRPGEEPKVIAARAARDRAFSVNDLAAAPDGAALYLTTLKDPDKGRLSHVDPKTGAVTVVFDGEAHPDLANPNGVAVSPDGKWLYVGISNYKNRKASGVYRLPIGADGTIDLPVRAGRWANVAAPDGIAVDASGRLYVTAADTVHVLAADAKKLGALRIPKDSGTSLCVTPDGTLYVTTNKALYRARLALPK